MKKNVLRIAAVTVTAALSCVMWGCGDYDGGCNGGYYNDDCIAAGNNVNSLLSKFSGRECSVTFDANGGTGAPAPITAPCGEYVTLPTSTNDMTREGYQRRTNGYNVLWYRTKNDANKGSNPLSYSSYYGGSDNANWYQLKGHETLYVGWELKTYEIYFDCNYSGNNCSRTAVTGEGWTVKRWKYGSSYDAITSLPTESRNHYTFNGWWTAEEGGDSITFDRVYSSDTTVYAHWTPNKYKVTFDANGGTVSPTSDSTGKERTLASLPSPTREGYYKFMGWCRDRISDGSGCSYNRGVTDTTVFYKDTTIYAVWGGSDYLVYTIWFDLNGGEWSTSPGVTSGKSYAATTGAKGTISDWPYDRDNYKPTRTYYTFNGWWTAREGGDSVKLDRVYSADGTIYAHWTPNKYKVTFNASGGTVSPAFGTASPPELTLDTLPTPTRTYYNFLGWGYYDLSNGRQVTVTKTTKFDQDRTIQASWSGILVYHITFNANGGTVTPVFDTTGTDGKLTKLPTPTRPDDNTYKYDFKGWYTSTFGETQVTTNTAFTQDATIYAQWTWSRIYIEFEDSRDGKKYKAVKIGNQTWMAENLNYAGTAGEPTGVCYDNTTSNCDAYGRLYTWEEANNACPTGWKLPSDAAWTQLTNYVGSSAGTRLKAESGWNNGRNGVDNYGFSALPGGGNNSGVGNDGYWWTATLNDASDAYYRRMSNQSGYQCLTTDNSWTNCYDSDVGRNYISTETNKYSVRCIKD